MRRIRITAGHISADAVLAANATADAVWDALPLSAIGNRWGDEIYFAIPVKLPLADDAREVVEAGELGYWPVGHAFCIFWGPTPASRGAEIRAYCPVNVLGRIEGDATVFGDTPDGAVVTIERLP